MHVHMCIHTSNISSHHTAAWTPVSPLNVVQPFILEMAFSHLMLEML